MSFRNRCEVAGSQGRINLSIPLAKGRDQKTLMKDIRIATHNQWQDQHWKTLLACYSRSPWFEFHRDELEKLYRTPFEFLLDWNLTCFEWTCRVLSLPLEIKLTDAYHPHYDEGTWLDYRDILRPKRITRTAGAAAPSEADAFATPIKYRQVFEEITGFMPNLSILDLLFCEGPRARSLLAQVAPTT